MTKIKHPTDRQQRLRLKNKYEEKKQGSKDRAHKVWRKRYKELTKEQESENELRQVLGTLDADT